MRRLPATFGLPWPDPGHLTISFVPDGTLVGSTPSTLNATLNAQLPTTVWRHAILSGFQAWAEVANINLAVVADDGEPLGTPGPLQGKPGVGDIRIAARPLAADAVALANPFDALGTWSGDVVLNSTDAFSLGGINDLFSVVAHEAGHVFGLDHNPSDPSTVMYPVETTPHLGLAPSDVAAIQALYGARQPGASEGAKGNDATATATPLKFVDLASIAGTWPLSADSLGSLYGTGAGNSRPIWAAAADISSRSEVDVYSIKAPRFGGALTAAVHAAGLSLLNAKVTVLDAAGNPLASGISASVFANDVVVTLPATLPGATYFVRVESAKADVFGVGAYRIAVGSPVAAPLLADPPAWVLAAVAPDPAKGTRFEKAADLTARTPGIDARWPFTVRDALTSPDETDFDRLPADSAAAGNPSASLVVTVWGLQTGGLTPHLTILDAGGNVVPARVLSRDASSVSVQVVGVDPSTRYVVEVSANDADGAHAVGGYFLGSVFRAAPITPDLTVADGVLNAGHVQDFRSLVVTTAGVFHFNLAGDPAAPATAAVMLTIFDAKKSGVAGLRAVGGSGASGNVFLTAGSYVVRLTGLTKSGAAPSKLHYSLSSSLRSDTIGPIPIDPTTTPAGTTINPPLFGWTTDPDPVYADFLDLTDVASFPWM